METAISALLVLGVLVLAIVGLTQYALSAQGQLTDASQMMQERAGDRARTALTPVGATTDVLGNYVLVTLKNTGSTRLADYAQWDVILQYTAASGVQTRWYAYGSSTNQWSKQIYLATSPLTAEVIEPEIINPGEFIVLQIGVTPAVSAGTTNVATIATPNGIIASTMFTR